MADSFVDFVAEPERLPEALALRKKAAAAQLAEARTYAQMLADIPTPVDAGHGHQIIDSRGMMAIGENLLHSLTRAASSQLVKPLAARVVPIGGTYDTLLACEGVGQFIDGIHESTGFHELCELVVQHSVVVPKGGHILWDVDSKKNLVPEVLHPLEVFISSDRSEVIFTRYIPRRQAKARWGKKPEIKELIADRARMPQAAPESIEGVDSPEQWLADDLIRVIEAYVVGVGDEPGKHFVYFDREHVLEETYTLPMIPIASMVWAPGFHGRAHGAPMARSVAGSATWLKELWWRIWDSAQACVPWIKNAKDDWQPTDVPFQKVPEGKDPLKPIEIEWPEAMSKDLVQLAKDLQANAGKATGIDDAAQASTPPSTLTSGVSIASWTAVRNEALGPQHAQFENLYRQSGKIICAYGPRLYKTKAAVLSARGSDVIRQVKWSELGVGEKDGFQVSFDVVSGLSKNLPQRMQMLELLLEKEVIDVGEYVASIELPDYRARAKRLGGPRAYVEYQIQQALGHDRLVPPNEMQEQDDLQMLVKSAKQAYLAAAASPVPPPAPRMSKLRLLWKLAKARLEGGSPAPANDNAIQPAELPPIPQGTLPGPAAPLPTDLPGLPTNPATGQPAPVGSPAPKEI